MRSAGDASGAQDHGATRHYYVDEAGDPVLWGRRGTLRVGTEGCSRFFILGLLDTRDPERLAEALRLARETAFADPYLAAVPSMAPEHRKTALTFHAKDDCPEVRWLVFSALREISDSLRFTAVVCDKRSHFEYVRQRSETDIAYRHSDGELYDGLVRRLFRDRLHKADAYAIRFAQRYGSDRTAALRQALMRAKERFRQRWGVWSDAPLGIRVSRPSEEPGLQAADYFLWALQRVYERQDGRYLDYLWGSFGVVHDIHDVRRQRYGEYYTQKSPLTIERLRERL